MTAWFEHPRYRRVRSRFEAAGRRILRRETMLATVVLVVPMIALAQPLGLLLWARLRLLTSIPRTALAEEDPTVASAGAGVDLFPDLPASGLPGPDSRDPLAISPEHFPKATVPNRLSEVEPKSGPESADEDSCEAARRERLADAVARIQVQGLVPGGGVALIDGRAHRVGDVLPDEIDGRPCRLVAVERSMVVVECDGIEFDIRLDGGGTGSVVIRPPGEELTKP